MRQHTWKSRLLLSLIFTSFIVLPVCASPQGSRAQEWAAKKARKAAALAPYQPNAAEEWVDRIERWGLLAPPTGLYPYFGSAYSGGGFAVGAGYRHYFADSAFLDGNGAWSISNYRMLDGTFRLPDLAYGTLKSRINVHYVHAGKVAFFGIGNDTTTDTETNYLYIPTTVDYSLLYQPGILALGGNVSYENYEIGEGEDANIPSIEEVFTPITAPGFRRDPQYLVTGVFAKLDWLQSPGYNTHGGIIQAHWQKYSEQNDLNFDFQRVDIETRQFIPILRANQVIALRALASFTDTQDGNQVPFFLLPKLGGGDELRGFPDFRFADRYRMLLTAEYRWTPAKYMDLALFYETGKVAAQSGDLDFNDLHDCYGFGVRFHTFAATPLRVDIAHSVEGTRIIFSGGTSF